MVGLRFGRNLERIPQKAVDDTKKAKNNPLKRSANEFEGQLQISLVAVRSFCNELLSSE